MDLLRKWYWLSVSLIVLLSATASLAEEPEKIVTDNDTLVFSEINWVSTTEVVFFGEGKQVVITVKDMLSMTEEEIKNFSILILTLKSISFGPEIITHFGKILLPRFF